LQSQAWLCTSPSEPSVRDEVLAPPGVEAATGGDEEKRLLDCRPEQGERPDLDAPLESPAGLAAHLAQESDQVSAVRCFEANKSDGWDLICTYFDPRTDERMKSGYRIGPGP
jgi:hypothetical protein